MKYKIKVLKPNVCLSRNRLETDDIDDAVELANELLKKFGEDYVKILKDGKRISFESLKNEEINSSFNDDNCVKSVFRKGYSSKSDLAMGEDGEVKSVWKPLNPE